MITIAFSAPIRRAETPSDLLNKVLPSHLSEVEVGKTSRDQVIKWFGKPGEEISDELAYNISGVDFDLTFKFKGDVVAGYYYEPTSEAALRDLRLPTLQKSVLKEIEEKKECFQKVQDCRLSKVQLKDLKETLYFSAGEKRLRAVKLGEP